MVMLIIKVLKKIKNANAYYKRIAARITSDDFKILKTVTVGWVSDHLCVVSLSIFPVPFVVGFTSLFRAECFDESSEECH